MPQLFGACFDIYHRAAISASVYISQRLVGRQSHLLVHKYLHSLSHCQPSLVCLNTAGMCSLLGANARCRRAKRDVSPDGDLSAIHIRFFGSPASSMIMSVASPFNQSRINFSLTVLTSWYVQGELVIKWCSELSGSPAQHWPCSSPTILAILDKLFRWLGVIIPIRIRLNAS